jgi:signal transduction histidine kinase
MNGNAVISLAEAMIQARGALAAAAAVQPAEVALARRLTRELDDALVSLEKGQPPVDLVSILCHDLKDPLASIVMGAAFLQKNLVSADPAVNRVVGAVARSADRLAAVVSDFHDLSKLQTGRMDVELRPYDVAALLPPALERFRPLAEAGRIQLLFERPDEPATALCDAARLLQVVSNLLSNAVRFTEAGGVVSVRVEAKSDCVRILVADTGRGIASDRLPTIFQHAANASRMSREGPGRGLAIVKGLLELQGAQVTVESTVGKGTSFTILLRKADQPASSRG